VAGCGIPNAFAAAPSQADYTPGCRNSMANGKWQMANGKQRLSDLLLFACINVVKFLPFAI
jgi:hypothetical protein